MPMWREGSLGESAVLALTPLAGARTGVTNDAGGLSAPIDCRGYKNVTLEVIAGVVGTSVDCKLQSSVTSGGALIDIPGAAITQITTGPAIVQLDAEFPIGRPFLQVVLIQVGATTVASAVLRRRDPLATSRP